MADETNLLHTEWLCMKYKYEKIAPVILHFNEYFLFENKRFKVGLKISSDSTVSERKQVSQDANKFLSKLNDICPQQVYDNILKNAPKVYPSFTKIPK